MKCRICNKDSMNISGYLVRVNEKGTDAIWECCPSCNCKPMSNEGKLIAALELEEKGGT